jgi:dienelactone hydrolase
MRVGFDGYVPKTGLADLSQVVFDLWYAGNHKEAFDMFGRVQAFQSITGAMQYILTARGVFKETTTIRDAHRIFGLDQQPQTDKKEKMGVQGYCMGGPLTFRTAATVANRIGAAATFHGGGLVTDKPDSPHLVIPQMKAELLCCVADNDDKRDPTAKDKLKEAFAAAHLTATVEVFEGCNHGWTVRGSQVYNEAGAERAWAERVTLYKRTLS